MARIYENGLSGAAARSLDRAIGFAFPGWARRRIEARAAVAQHLNYDAAADKRSRRRVKASSADMDLLEDLPQIRENSRAMVRDDSTAAALCKVFKDNVVGTGMVPQSVATQEETGLSDSQVEDWNRSCEQVFLEWAKDQADATQHESFWGLQRQVMHSMVSDGECLVKRTSVPVGGGRQLASAVEIIDSDRLLSPRGDARDIRGGIELGLFGEPISYWITPRHPDELRWRLKGRTAFGSSNDPVPFPKTSGGLPLCMHVFDRDRAGQSRGVPMFAASFALVEALNDYLQSEVIAARAASKIALYIKQLLPNTSSALSQDAAGDGAYYEKLESGTIRYMNPGEEPVSFNPGRPGAMFDPFVVRILKSICSSFGLAYEFVIRDFGQMNYSSARVAIMESRRPIEHLQDLMQRMFCDPWWYIVVTEALLRGLIRVPNGFGANPRPFFRTMWVPPTWGYVDPEKEIAASVAAVDANVSTPQIEASRNGQDVEDVLRQRARMLKKAAEIETAHGLEPGVLTTPRAPKQQQPAAEPAPEAAPKAKEPKKEPVPA